jgi:hypothetical protein
MNGAIVSPGRSLYGGSISHHEGAVGSEPADLSNVYVEGVVGGLIGAATFAIWCFSKDIFIGRQFYTAN